jgi:hypothetical protein
MQCGYLIPPQCTTSMHLLAKKFTKLQSVHTFKHTSKKQINWNPCVFVHYVVKENIELCTMSMSNNEHAHNIDSKLTNNLQSVHIFNALKKKKTLKSIYVYALCIMHSKKLVSCAQYWCWAMSMHATLVTTLALGSRLRQGLAKVRAKSEPKSHISCSREYKRVRGNDPPHSQMNSHFGSWSPDGFLNLQRAISKVKTHWIETLPISLKIDWNVDV